MGNLILCRSERAKNPYYVEELGIRLYSGEELSYYIYHNLMLIGDDFLGEKLYQFIGQELKLPELENKLRKWANQTSQAELLLVILQDIHYYNSTELFAFKEELTRLSKVGPAELMKEKADYLLKIHRCYESIRLYDRVLASKSDELLSEGFRGNVWFHKGAALAAIFSFEQALQCYRQAYELLQSEEALRKIYEIHLMDPLVQFPEELFADVSGEMVYRWKTEFEEKRKEILALGKAKEANALKERDNIRRAAGYCQLVQAWKNEYRRSQG